MVAGAPVTDATRAELGLCVVAGVNSALDRVAREAGWRTRSHFPLTVASETNCDETVALVVVAPDSDCDELRVLFPAALLVCDGGASAGADFSHKQPLDTEAAERLLTLAERLWQQGQHARELQRELRVGRRYMHQLSEIGVALSAPMDARPLLETILTTARRLAQCDGGSLYLVERGATPAESALVFKLAQNTLVDCPFIEARLPLTIHSVAGYVALSGQEQNIEDVYKLPDSTPYRFNGTFDEQLNYRTRSMLVLPMRDHRQRVLGVLQFINRRDPETRAHQAFDDEIAALLRGVASQAALAIQKNALVEEIHDLFESFVQASVIAIEKRDPTTSGHSFRVATTTVALMEALPQSGHSRFRSLELTPEHLREVRYAALLHDFGKVGVPERVLLKANKLSDERLEVIRYRIELQKERLRYQSLQEELKLYHRQPVDLEVARHRLHRTLARKLALLDQYFDAIDVANKPNVVDSGEFAHLAEVRAYDFQEFDGQVGGLISDADVQALSVRRGSLTPEERRAIETHVSYTKDFLSALPWPEELAQVPAIAGAHHEKLNGKGYPEGLTADEIPLAAKAMAVCDIFDALTAMDRPYKQAMSRERAFSILQHEVDAGLIDGDLTQIFIDSGSWSATGAAEGSEARRRVAGQPARCAAHECADSEDASGSCHAEGQG